MSSLAFSESHYPVRRVAVRRLALVEALAPAPVVVSPQESLREETLQPGQKSLLAAAVVVLLAHVAVAAWLHRPAAVEAVTPPQIPPITVDLAPPPELPPPPVLKKELPPPPPVQKVQPRPEPVPVSEPVKTEAAPVETPPPPAPVAPVAPPAPPVEKVTLPDAYAGYLRNPAPAYPAFAQERGWEGSVLLRVHVLETGKPDTVSVKKSSGRKILDEAAVRAVQHWSFVPAKRGATPIDGWVDVPVDYKLN